MIGAEVLAGLHFFGAAGGREDGAVKGLGELDRRGADSRGAAVHQEALARLQGRALEHVHPDREEGLRQAGRLLQREALRSEEHTSELQSLMRISYAVFCLKKKKNK